MAEHWIQRSAGPSGHRHEQDPHSLRVLAKGRRKLDVRLRFLSLGQSVMHLTGAGGGVTAWQIQAGGCVRAGGFVQGEQEEGFLQED